MERTYTGLVDNRNPGVVRALDGTIVTCWTSSLRLIR